jgi:ketosteroid isomerase-like protein
MSQGNGEAIRAGYEALNRRDIPGVLAVMEPDLEFVPLVGNLDGRVYRGHEGMVEYIETMSSEWENIAWDLRRLIEVDAETVVAVVRMRARSRLGIDVDQEAGVVAAMRAGKAARLTTYPRAAEAFEAVGLSE